MPRTLLVLTLLVLLSGCIQAEPDDAPQDEEREQDAPSSDPPTCTPPAVTPSGPGGGQGGVSNQPGAFSYGGQAAAKTAKEVYVWENPSRSAQVAWGGQSAAGTLTLTIQDHCGKEVYRADLGGAPGQGGANEGTQEGEAGDWILTLEFTLYTGQMGLSVSSA